MRRTTRVAMFAVLLAGGGCDTPAGKRRAAEKASDDVTKAEQEAEKDVADAKRKAGEKVAEAQRRARESEAEAQAAEERASSVFRGRIDARLELVDADIAAVRSAPLEGKTKEDADISLVNLDARRAQLQKDLDKLKTTAPALLAEDERKILDALTTLEKDADDAASKAKASART